MYQWPYYFFRLLLVVFISTDILLATHVVLESHLMFTTKLICHQIIVHIFCWTLIFSRIWFNWIFRCVILLRHWFDFRHFLVQYWIHEHKPFLKYRNNWNNHIEVFRSTRKVCGTNSSISWIYCDFAHWKSTFFVEDSQKKIQKLSIWSRTMFFVEEIISFEISFSDRFRFRSGALNFQ